MNHPLLLAVLTVGGVYTAGLWLGDLRRARAGRPQPRAFPGAVPATASAVLVAIAGALLLVAVETAGEFALGVAEQQSRITWLFALYSVLAAPVLEELVFRGFLVVENRGRPMMWAAAAGASLGFALLHPHLWSWDEAGFALTPGAKGAFTTGMLFVSSMWFYLARLAPWNANRSLLPCFAAHAAKNAAVIAIKAALGFMGGAW